MYNNETYTGTVMSKTVRALLSVAATKDLKLGCLDVKTAFLYGTVPTISTFIFAGQPVLLT